MESSKFSHDHQWVINVSRFMEQEYDEDKDKLIPAVSIFKVPKALMSAKPEAYAPQLVALGPYHHRRLEAFEMEHHKLNIAKRVRNNMKTIEFPDLINHISENELRARACYHQYLDYDRETLTWIFAIDTTFLLECLHTYSSRSDEAYLTQGSLKMGDLIDYTRRKTSHQVILRDIIMLENQIPLFLLREIHGFNQQDKGDEVLASLLMGFCKDLSPLKYLDGQRFISDDCFAKAHLLELLYYMVMPGLPLKGQAVDEPHSNDDDDEEENKGCFRKTLQSFCFVSSALIQLIVKILKSKVAMLLITLPYKIALRLFNLGSEAGVVDSVMSSAQNTAEEVESAVDEKDESPLAEELAIPSVSQLAKVGVRFCPTEGGLSSIKFHEKSGTFHLPVIHINDNSEVVLRNLVAYEASIAPEVMLFTRYVELMNGLIDTEEDASVLTEAGVFQNRLKNHKEATVLWNGITKSVKVTKVPVLDKTIQQTKAYYSGSLKVKIRTAAKRYFYGSWPCLTFLAVNMLVLLSAVNAFCSVYQCSKWVCSQTKCS